MYRKAGIIGLDVVCRSQWKDGSTGGKAVLSCDVTDSVASESKYEVRSLWRKRSMACESSNAEVAILLEQKGKTSLREKEKRKENVCV